MATVKKGKLPPWLQKTSDTAGDEGAPAPPFPPKKGSFPPPKKGAKKPPPKKAVKK